VARATSVTSKQRAPRARGSRRSSSGDLGLGDRERRHGCPTGETPLRGVAQGVPATGHVAIGVPVLRRGR
jgi:hypothetical protein